MKKMRKQLLTIILLSLLAITGFTALSTPQVNADKSDVSIISYSWYVAPTDDFATDAGDLVVVGELENVGTTNIEYIYLNGFAYVNDTEVAYASRQPFGNNIEPGQKVSFYLDFSADNSYTYDLSWVSNVTDVIVTPGYIKYSDLEMYQDLTVSSDSSNDGVYTVTGTVQNEGTETIGDVRVITTFYNSEGTVVCLNYTEILSDSLAPGDSVSFTAVPMDSYPSSEIASYSTLVQSTIQLSETTSSPTSTPTTTTTPTPTATATTTPTETPDQTSSDNNTLLIIAVAAVVVLIIVVVILLMRRSRGNNEQAQ